MWDVRCGIADLGGIEHGVWSIEIKLAGGSTQQAEERDQRTEDGGQRTEFRIANCGFQIATQLLAAGKPLPQ